jgi:hypothetical protein
VSRDSLQMDKCQGLIFERGQGGRVRDSFSQF